MATCLVDANIGHSFFVECLRQSVKLRKLSVKSSSSMILYKEVSLTGTTSLPSTRQKKAPVGPFASFTTGIRGFAECRALGKKGFTECHTRQSSTLGNEPLYRVQDTRHRTTLGKDMKKALGKGPLASVLKLTAVSLCREPMTGTRLKGFFAECQILGTRQRRLCRVSSINTRQTIFLFFTFWPPNFLWYVPTLCTPTCTILGQL
jgi:hypothetical protein